jgi:putative thioredoxin
MYEDAGQTRVARARYNGGMSQPTAHVRDISDADFDAAVLARSHEVPVLVDFWAAWCGPCRMLGPVLEKLAEERGGAFELAKLDTDKNPKTAAKFGIRGIPHVMLFKNGRSVDQFVGAKPEEAVRTFLNRHCPSAADQHMAAAQQHLAAGDQAAAEKALKEALSANPGHAGANLAMARLALHRRDAAAVQAHIARIPAQAPERDQAAYIEQAATLMASVLDGDGTSDEDTLAARVAETPGDHAARYALGVHHLAAGRYREALDAFLEVVERDRKWQDQAARKAMLTVFGLVGVRDPLADEYRRKLMIFS